MPANTFIATAAAVVDDRRAAGVRRRRRAHQQSGSGACSRRAIGRAGRKRSSRCICTAVPAPMREILDVAAGIPVIEDAAQAHGARYAGAAPARSATAGCFSFYPTKNLGAFGDAGLITTNDDTLADAAQAAPRPRPHQPVRTRHRRPDGASRQPAGRRAARAGRRARGVEREAPSGGRRGIASCSRRRCLSSGDDPPTSPCITSSSCAWRIATRSALISRRTVSRRPCTTRCRSTCSPRSGTSAISAGDFPVTERLARDIVSLPMHPFLERAQVQHIARASPSRRVTPTMINVGLIGYGYWGPNLARNLAETDGVRADGDRRRARRSPRGGGAAPSGRDDCAPTPPT